MPTPVSIVIPAFNQVEYCRQCVHSLLANTPQPCKLILVDNGSTDDVPAFFDSVPGACVVHSETNRGFAGGVNLGMAHAEGHVVLLNSDTLLPEGWLERLLAPLDRHPDAGMVGPVSNCVSGIQQIETPSFQSLDEISGFARGLADAKSGSTVEVERLVGFCLLIRDRVVREVGVFDEGFGIGNYEDDDYCLRVRRAGYRLLIAEDAFVFHYGSRTFLGMDLVGERWTDLMERNRRRFVEKWTAPEGVSEPARQRAAELAAEAREAVAGGGIVEALRLLTDAVKHNPADPILYNDLGVVLWQAGEAERAVEQFRRALRLDPAFEDARRNLQDAEAALGGGQANDGA